MILEKLEPYIAENLDLLTAEDLINCFVGFSHPHCQKRLTILDEIEEKIIASASLGQLKIEESADMLYEFSQLQIGSKSMITAVATLLDQQIVDQYSAFKAAEFKMTDATKINFDSFYSAVVALDIVRHGNWMRSIYQMGKMYLATRDIEGDAARQLSYDEAYMLYKMFLDLQEVRP